MAAKYECTVTKTALIAICRVRGIRFRKPSRLLISLKLWSRPGKSNGTAWQLHQRVKEYKTAETNRERAETCILKIANSFAPDEPLRATFLAAAPVRRILRETVVNKGTRQHRLRRGAALRLEQLHLPEMQTSPTPLGVLGPVVAVLTRQVLILIARSARQFTRSFFSADAQFG